MEQNKRLSSLITQNKQNDLISNRSIDDIKLNIEQLDVKNNYLKINSPFKAYILLLRPKTIFELFEKHSFKLFFKNVRNPLLHSKVNENIETTLKTEMPFFWYFNNGITALTNDMPSRINPTAKSITISGFQVINGAQTVYSIYKSYKEAKPRARRIMNAEALLTLRLLVVNSEDLSLKITRFTNSQNPMEDRDFWANDEVQIRLQQESFQTSFWYEKRRSEFREVPNNIRVIPNTKFAIYHLAFNLQKPSIACKALLADKDLFFISRKEDKNGLYEDIFLENEKPIAFDDMFAAYLFAEIVREYIAGHIANIAKSNFLQNIALSKILLEKYIIFKYNSKTINIAKFIITKTNDEKIQNIFVNLAEYSNILIKRFLKINASDNYEYQTKLNDFITNPVKFEIVKEHFEELKMDQAMWKEIEEM